MEMAFDVNKMQFTVKLDATAGAEMAFSQSDKKFDVDMQSGSACLTAEVNTGVKRFDASIKDYQAVTVYKDAEPYTGSYQITPKVTEQRMPTAQKLMTQDVTVKAIPYYDVSNTSGGSTVYIAKEL